MISIYNTRLWTYYENGLKLMHDRGYNITFSIEKDKFILNTNRVNHIIAEKDDDKIMMQILSDDVRLLKDEFMSLLRRVPSAITHIIIVANVKIKHKRIQGLQKSRSRTKK